MENGNGTHGTITVKEAAERLGISPRGVRQRITRGRLKATQLNGEWLVYLGEHAEPVPENNGTGNTTSEQTEFPGTAERGTRYRRSPVPQPQQQLDMVMSGWLKPLVDQIAQLERDKGRLEERVEERDRQIEELRAALVPKDDISQVSYQGKPKTWLQRLMGL